LAFELLTVLRTELGKMAAGLIELLRGRHQLAQQVPQFITDTARARRHLSDLILAFPSQVDQEVALGEPIQRNSDIGNRLEHAPRQERCCGTQSDEQDQNGRE
jgi:hypothetical protein